MPAKVKWGILSTANIALKKVIPAMQQGARTEITAIASRDLARAREAARELNIPRAYGSYEELLADPEIEAIYNPLPNHLHVPWSVKAAEAGKHVLCEKPISMTVAECRDLIAVRDRTGVKIGEAFMIRSHPRWHRAREVVRSGEIGDLRSVAVYFSYFNDDPDNVRNILEYGGGGLMDIGCYAIQFSRYLFGAEPTGVAGLIERDPAFGTDRLASAVMQFPAGHAIFTCSTQLAPYQEVQVLGTKGRIEMDMPCNAPPDRPTMLHINDRAEEFPICDQYTLQGDDFSRAVRGDADVPTPLEDSLRNMAVIETLLQHPGTVHAIPSYLSPIQ